MNAASSSVSEDASQILKVPEDFIPISEILDADDDGEITETLLEDASSVNFLRSDVIPPVKITDGTGSCAVNCFGDTELDSSKFASVEADIAVKFLRKTQSEVLNSVSAAPQYRELIDEVINFVMKEHNMLPEERDRVAQVVSIKNQIVFLCFLLWIIGVSAVIFFTSDTHRSFSGALPT
ncbi:protein SINE3 [Senna tora]|uniref:Protein SINE3 n=1 Tax=Senna tora TaxID=362788 RepID=A0A835CC43_9FABA|nr:protein SINE3 [Senna tora]